MEVGERRIDVDARDAEIALGDPARFGAAAG